MRVKTAERLSPSTRMIVGDRKKKVKQGKYVVNLSGTPFIPEGLSVSPNSEQLPNRVRGNFRWDPSNISLYRSPRQRGGEAVNGYQLCEVLVDKRVAGAKLLDHLIAHPDLIPNRWKGISVFFWGTIYQDPNGYLYVRFLHWDRGQWHSSYSRFSVELDADNPALLLAA